MAPRDLWDLNMVYQPVWWLHYIELFEHLNIQVIAVADDGIEEDESDEEEDDV